MSGNTGRMRNDKGRHYQHRPIPPWPDVQEAEAQDREERGRCPSCAVRQHECTGIDCNCPRLTCTDIQRQQAAGPVLAALQEVAEREAWDLHWPLPSLAFSQEPQP